MAQEKYSPTVTVAYSRDQEWFKKNGGGFDNGKNPNSDNDDDGFDSYGYSYHDGIEGADRSGYTESDYLLDSIAHNGNHHLYFDVESEWSFDGKKPVHK